jgi:hypothetical protein
VNLQGDLKSDFNTYERTNGLTKKLGNVDSHLTAVDADARTEIPTLGEVIDEATDSTGLWLTDARHPVTRRGERNEIPLHVRHAVWFRDRGKCELCGDTCPTGQPWHLDHITPWSAGGSDDTTNLRVLCERHNMNRSNRVDPTERPRRAATWIPMLTSFHHVAYCAHCDAPAVTGRVL